MSTIVNQFTDVAGKRRYFVDNGAGVVMVKFDKDAPRDEVLAAADKQFVALADQAIQTAAKLAADAATAEKLALVKDVSLADLKTKLSAGTVGGTKP